jgi:hypothetical protein
VLPKAFREPIENNARYIEQRSTTAPTGKSVTVPSSYVVEHPVAMSRLAPQKAFAADQPDALDKSGFVRSPQVVGRFGRAADKNGSLINAFRGGQFGKLALADTAVWWIWEAPVAAAPC